MWFADPVSHIYCCLKLRHFPSRYLLQKLYSSKTCHHLQKNVKQEFNNLATRAFIITFMILTVCL